jgi:hypothetical protein
MRLIFLVILIVAAAPSAYAQAVPAGTPHAIGGPPMPVSKLPSGGAKLTKFVCKPICAKAGLGPLAGDELNEFTACANAQLCNEIYPPVAYERRDILDIFGWSKGKT